MSSAVIHFSQAIEYDNSHVKALRNRASAYERMGYFIMAESDLGDAINLVDAEKDPKLHEYLKNELKRVEDVADEQERKREQAFDKMMRGPQKVCSVGASPPKSGYEGDACIDHLPRA